MAEISSTGHNSNLITFSLVINKCLWVMLLWIILKSDNFDYGNIEMLKRANVNLSHKTDCFIYSNDFIAISICKALESFGKSIPEDVLVVGFDNVPESVAAYPKITTESFDSKELGNKVIVTLINRIKSPSANPIL